MIERPKELTTPEQLHGYIADLEQYGKQADSDLATMKTQHETSAERIKSLEEHNQRLFLKAEANTTEENTQEKQEEEPVTAESVAALLLGKEG